MRTKREAVVARLKELNATCAPLVRVLSDANKVKDLITSDTFTMENLIATCGVSTPSLPFSHVIILTSES